MASKASPLVAPFEFGEGITAIVGPNGSGKSNIADAIRWVLGEQNFRSLRAKTTEDMIFAGSRNRPRQGMAEVLITLDNTEGWLPLDFSEVTIGRRAYRSGENEYLLNGNRVRYHDIVDAPGPWWIDEKQLPRNRPGDGRCGALAPPGGTTNPVRGGGRDRSPPAQAE